MVADCGAVDLYHVLARVPQRPGSATNLEALLGSSLLLRLKLCFQQTQETVPAFRIQMIPGVAARPFRAHRRVPSLPRQVLQGRPVRAQGPCHT